MRPFGVPIGCPRTQASKAGPPPAATRHLRRALSHRRPAAARATVSLRLHQCKARHGTCWSDVFLNRSPRPR